MLIPLVPTTLQSSLHALPNRLKYPLQIHIIQIPIQFVKCKYKYQYKSKHKYKYNVKYLEEQATAIRVEMHTEDGASFPLTALPVTYQSFKRKLILNVIFIKRYFHIFTITIQNQIQICDASWPASLCLTSYILRASGGSESSMFYEL